MFKEINFHDDTFFVDFTAFREIVLFLILLRPLNDKQYNNRIALSAPLFDPNFSIESIYSQLLLLPPF